MTLFYLLHMRLFNLEFKNPTKTKLKLRFAFCDHILNLSSQRMSCIAESCSCTTCHVFVGKEN